MELVRRLLDDYVDPQTQVRRNDLHRQESSGNAETQRLVNLYLQKLCLVLQTQNIQLCQIYL